MSRFVDLPQPGGAWRRYPLVEPPDWPVPAAPARSRVAFAAAHVVADPWEANTPGAPAGVDWEATLAVRARLHSYGLGVAEAMDTAQRGMGLDWPTARELIARSAEQAAALGGRIAAGAGTDQLPPGPAALDAVLEAYLEQVEHVQATGAQVIVMASRHLAAAATSVDDYRKVYDRVLARADRPVILHWLGTAFDPALAGYWGSAEVDRATEHFVTLVRENAPRVDGVKVSLLDAGHETALRRALPAGVRLYTGDDFNYPELIKGDGTHHSDALLGIFAAIAPAAAAALAALDRDDPAGYEAAFAPTLPLARHVFAVPTYYYKTGIAFLSWLSGTQPGFTMVGGLQSARGALHLAQVFALAADAGLLPDPELAARRMTGYLDLCGLSR